jgi:predicted transcriptional regulator
MCNYTEVVFKFICAVTHMSRRNILKVIEDIIILLKTHKELSVKSIADNVHSQWETTIKALEFMKKLSLVKEKSGKKTNKTERLFSLKA